MDILCKNGRELRSQSLFTKVSKAWILLVKKHCVKVGSIVQVFGFLQVQIHRMIIVC